MFNSSLTTSQVVDFFIQPVLILMFKIRFKILSLILLKAGIGKVGETSKLGRIWKYPAEKIPPKKLIFICNECRGRVHSFIWSECNSPIVFSFLCHSIGLLSGHIENFNKCHTIRYRHVHVSKRIFLDHQSYLDCYLTLSNNSTLGKNLAIHFSQTWLWMIMLNKWTGRCWHILCKFHVGKWMHR